MHTTYPQVALIGGLNRDNEEEFEQLRFKKVIVHEQYKDLVHLNDIALLQLAQPSALLPIRVNVVCGLGSHKQGKVFGLL
jgi:secreted trypsin-like serine protease